MARVSTWFHFAGNAEEAFRFYQSIFKTEFVGPITRFRDIPTQPGQPTVSAAEANKIMHIALPDPRRPRDHRHRERHKESGRGN